MTIESYVHLPSIPVWMGIAFLLVIAGAIANNFIAAYIHGMTRCDDYQKTVICEKETCGTDNYLAAQFFLASP